MDLRVDLGQLLQDTLDLFPGDTIPPESVAQMHKVVSQQAKVAGLLLALQKSLGPAIALSRQGQNEPLERIFDVLMGVTIQSPEDNQPQAKENH